jgi:hypothetical protein
MNKALPLVCALLLLAGCSYISPQSNQPPEAHIASISPAESTEGETVAFSGEGIDADGEVVGYRWRSDLDGELSRLAAFQTDSLSVGVHTIDFMVQDNQDAWSDRAHGYVKVFPAVAAAMARVRDFEASLSTIEPGESVTLSWNVSDATSVSIDHGIGAVPASGSMIVTPDVTTTYELTATSADFAVIASVTVTVQQADVSQVTLTADDELSGYIRSSGVERNIGIYVGDDDANRDIQGFLTFDISDIPDDATITRVILDLSGYDTPYDLPYPGLGCLRAYVHEYGSLGGQYWTGKLTNPIGEWCNFADLDIPTGSPGFRDALQEQLGEKKFQFRLQFSDPHSDLDGTRDLLHWERGSLPTLIVEYSADE